MLFIRIMAIRHSLLYLRIVGISLSYDGTYVYDDFLQ